MSHLPFQDRRDKPLLPPMRWSTFCAISSGEYQFSVEPRQIYRARPSAAGQRLEPGLTYRGTWPHLNLRQQDQGPEQLLGLAVGLDAADRERVALPLTKRLARASRGVVGHLLGDLAPRLTGVRAVHGAPVGEESVSVQMTAAHEGSATHQATMPTS
jgi:hypothetical protein